MPKMYKDDFTNARRLAWVRSKSQAIYRGEVWNLTFSEFCKIWSTEELWRQRGRSANNLVLTRYDPDLPWEPFNLCLISRALHLAIKNARTHQQPYLHLYETAIPYE